MIKAKRSRLFNRLNIVIFLFLVVSIFAAFIPYFKIDLLITDSLQRINSGVFQNVMWFVSNLGNQPTMFFIVAITSLLLFIFKLRIEAIVLSLSAAGSALSGSILKLLIDRPRPTSSLVRVSVWLSDKSFPSNHVLVFTVFFGFLLYLLFFKAKRNVRDSLVSIILFLLISSIGVSRIYLGAHWASDVLGGYLLGIVWLIFTIRLYNSYHGQR
jgi:membrane-associated phospholipid phosphatase